MRNTITSFLQMIAATVLALATLSPALAGRPGGSGESLQAAPAAIGGITGTVTFDGSGAPAAVAVYLYTSRANNSSAVNSTTSVAASGRYTFSGLSAGTYYIGFDNTSNSSILAEFYSDKTTLQLSTPVTVTTGATQTINAQVMPGAVIQGTITRDEGGTNWSIPLIDLYDSNQPDANFVRRIIGNSNGTFSGRGIAPGTYYAYFNTFHDSAYVSEWYGDTYSRSLAAPIVAVSGQTNTLNVGLARGAVITGSFTAASGGAPVQGSVSAYPSRTANNYTAYANTNPNNVYTMTGLPPGVYYLYAEPDYASNYFPEYYSDQPTKASATPVTVSVNTTTNINFAFTTGAIITGRVVEDGSGAPIAGVSASASSMAEGSSEYRSAETDASGFYTITRLTGGGYTLYFSTNDSNHLSEYYDNTQDSPGTVITVAAQSMLQNINASLKPGGQVLGRVTAADTSGGLGSVYVTVYLKQGDNYNQTGSTTTDASGYYTVPRLGTGTYRIKFEGGSGAATAYLTEYYNNARSLESATDFSVTVSANTTGINAALDRGGQISGRVIGEDSQSGLQLVYVWVYSGTEALVRAQTNSNGEYTTEGVPAGSYNIKFEPYEAWPVTGDYAGEWYNNTHTIPTPVVVSAGNTTQNINAELAIGAVITGIIQYAADSFAYVRFYDAGTGERLRQDFKSGGTSSNFTLKGVAPGTYKIGFYGGAPSLARGQVEYLEIYYDQKASLAAATVITVTGAETIPGINGRMTTRPGVALDQKVSLPLVSR